MADPEDTIQTNLEGPKRVVVDGQIVEQYDMDNQIKAAEYLERKAAQGSGKSKLGIARYKIRPGGSL